MIVNLGGEIEFECIQIENARNAEILSQETDNAVYSWKTVGHYNWLEKGFSVVDVLGLTILPNGLPDKIDLPNDDKRLL